MNATALSSETPTKVIIDPCPYYEALFVKGVPSEVIAEGTLQEVAPALFLALGACYAGEGRFPRVSIPGDTDADVDEIVAFIFTHF